MDLLGVLVVSELVDLLREVFTTETFHSFAVLGQKGAFLRLYASAELSITADRVGLRVLIERF